MEEESDITKLTTLQLKAVAKAVHDMLVKQSKLEIADDPQAFIDKWYPNHEGCISDQIGAIAAQKTAPYTSNKKLSDKDAAALMVTFSPDPSLGLDYLQLNTLATKLCKLSKGVCESMFVIEQRGVDIMSMGTGAHFHALLILNKKEPMGEPARQTDRAVKMFVKYKTTTTHFLDVKRVSSSKLQEKIDYVMGHKNDPEKQLKTVIDYEWRKKYDAPPFITFSNPLGKNVIQPHPRIESKDVNSIVLQKLKLNMAEYYEDH